MLNKFLKRPQKAIEAVLDLPQINANLPGIITVAGWALSRRATIERIEIWLGGRFLGIANYGLARPDVATQHGQSFRNCGYHATFGFDPATLKLGSTELAVSINASNNKRKLIKRLCNIIGLDPAFAPPQAQIESAFYRNGVLELKGWAVWPTDEPPRQVTVYHYASIIGHARLNLSRPDIQTRFPDNPIAYRCGFHYIQPFPTEKNLSGITVEFDDARQRPLRLITQLMNISLNWDNTPNLANQFERLTKECQSQLASPPSVLDWHSGLPLKTFLPNTVIFSPLPNSNAFLYYISQSIDIVVLTDANEQRLQEARRVASLAVVLVDKATLEIEWLANELAETEIPGVSIIIPVYNKFEYTHDCLTQLFATLPVDFSGEVIVVDDASNDTTPQVLRDWAIREPRLKVLRNDKNLGFIGSCNHGANTASGEFLLFLNNDTLPQHGWLLPLLQTFKAFPNVGAVGGKLTYPQNILQEAGNVIFSDGSGCNFGKHADPNHPLFNFVREVDYCSGALLMTRRALFIELGGFDRLYTPAYYEDTDYCFAVRERGYKVYYQPASEIIHFEGISSGTDVKQGVKSYQLANRAKFVEKWQPVLQYQPAPSYNYDYAMWHRLAFYARGSNQPLKKALLCAARMPEFDRESGLQRLYHFIQFLQGDGWAVSFVAHNANGGERYAALLQQMGVATYAGAGSSLIARDYRVDFDALVDNSDFDLAILVAWDVAELYLPTIRSLSPSTRVVVDSLDLHFVREARRQLARTLDEMLDENHLVGAGFPRPGRGDRTPTKPVLVADFADTKQRELNVYTAADLVLTVSQKEADLLNDLTANSHLAHVVADAEDLEPSLLPFKERKGMLFVGNFRHPPNRAALDFLLNQIVPVLDPALLVEHPLYIVGNGLDEVVEGRSPLPQNMDGVKMVGWVPSLLPYLQKVRVSLLPLTYGAGTKRKLIQSLLVGTPAVSTSIGVEGLDLVDGEHVLVADDPTSFADAITHLLHDENLWQHLSTSGHAHIVTTHSLAAARQQFLNILS